ncbi:MAG: hypothetical protein FWH03_05945 [Firmicutes bacterium]|nr:hypothetical protein [Bacillota bacterium]
MKKSPFIRVLIALSAILLLLDIIFFALFAQSVYQYKDNGAFVAAAFPSTQFITSLYVLIALHAALLLTAAAYTLFHKLRLRKTR